LCIHDRALADRQCVLRGDLTLDLALDANRPLEGELPDHAASLPQECVAPAAPDVLGHGSLPREALPPPPPRSSGMARPPPRSPEPTLPTPDEPDVPMAGGSNEPRSF